ncbi:M50 family metallopeptidase [Nocardioides sp. DS6]|uniref:M50 family metallopeptidase n=1 Tax=Nocardioides eburneus TaxID=3231482 RepID=A0ABV3SX65_9ACTN
MTQTLRRLWDHATAVQPVPEPAWVIGTGVVALLLVLHRPTWQRVRLGITVVHEAGHALVAVLVGRRLSGIRLHSDTSGVTVSRGRPRGPGMVLMLAAGYLAPGLLGLLAALLLTAGHALGLLWILVVVLLALLVWVRNGYGLLTVVVLGGALAVVSVYAAGPVQSTIATLVTWLLLLAAPRPVLELLGRGRAVRRGSDVDQLARITPLPALLWAWLLLAADLAGLAVGAATLVPQLVS